MFATMLIGLLALVLAMAVGALVAPAARVVTVDAYDSPWQFLSLSATVRLLH